MSYKFYNGKREITFKPDEIIAIHTFNPLQTFPNQVSGTSTVQAIAVQASMDNAILKWNWNFFENNASMGTVFETDKTIDSKKQSKFMRSFEARYKGVKNAFKTLFLDNGIKMREIQP